jgi:four helix bundle protein
MAENVIVTKSFDFAVKIVEFGYRFQKENREYIISRQLLRSGTSVGANIEEAQGAISKADFNHKLHISLKEAKESKFWLRLVLKAGLVKNNKEVEILQKECEEIIVILTSILKTSKSRQ